MTKHTMTETVEKNIDKIPQVYQLDMEQLSQLYELSLEDVFKAFSLAYYFGLIRGARAGKKGKIPPLY